MTSVSAVNLDGLLSSSPSTRGELTDHPLSVSVSILPNADIVIGDENIQHVSDKSSGQDKDDHKSKLARALDIAGDIDVWVEFMKSQAEQSGD